MSRHFPAVALAATASVLFVALSGPSVAGAATRRTTASTAKVAAKKQVTAVATTRVVPTTQPAPRRAGVPVKGWPELGAGEWPTTDLAISVRPKSTSVKVYPEPDPMVASLRFDAGKTVFGKVTLLVVGARDGWWKVLMPVRPNGTVGWVRVEDVERVDLHARIVIELDTNTLTYTKDGKVVLKDRVAAGTGGTPTPTGLFFVKEIVPQGNPRGALGPVALGLSGFSEVLYSFAGGSGVIGIHGTNNPSLLGKDVSHGCVRMRNESITAIAAAVDLGTPVEIVKTLSDLPAVRWSLPAGTDMSPAPVAIGAPASTVGSADGSTATTTTTTAPAA